MKKLDWYILKKFFTTFFFSIFLFTIIAVAVDVSEKTDDFVASGLSATDIIMKYYIGFVPYIIALLFPLFVFIAVIFFTSKLALKSELIAILASGTSFNRMMRPYWVGGITLGLLLVVSANYYIPKAQEIRTSFEAKYVNVNSTYDPLVRSSHNVYFRIDSFTYAGIRNYDTGTKAGGPFFMQRVKNDELVYNLRAEVIRWDTAIKNWRLQTVLERNINGLQEKVDYSQKKEMKFNFKPFDLSHDEYAKDKLTTAELHQFVQLEKLRGSEGLNALEIEQYKRFATPLAVVILTIIGAAIASRKVRGGSGAHIAIGIVLAVTFILMDRFSTIFSTKGSLPPYIAAWIPDVFFSFIAIYIYRKTPK
ncbi:YjgP/YjgQ family permease [Panacibacter ginsenosidivorans]|uniref:YjgP/YjgQ family permease n=1 Tax=Panacibacter ginsenosidivorans TaxID=1813871 RepID=A0A5B8V8L8_9BACT|nr:LptF/LptG family permease [Panacibacter ginsenosidivorans]QEC67253.1 YjgP/YjgQ family permease [Panacibacter ginsenosidivorans]